MKPSFEPSLQNGGPHNQPARDERTYQRLGSHPPLSKASNTLAAKLPCSIDKSIHAQMHERGSSSLFLALVLADFHTSDGFSDTPKP